MSRISLPACCLLLIACSPDRPLSLNVGAAAALPSATTAVVTSAAPTRRPPPSACRAPSLSARAAIDARDSAALARCQAVATGDPRVGMRCGMAGPEPSLNLARLERSVMPLDETTLNKVRKIAARGAELGRRQRVVGFVGDSMTVSGALFRAFASTADADRVKLAPEVRAQLKTTVDGDAERTIIDFYRGVKAQRIQGQWRDSFAAPRAARVGARTPWALKGGAVSPLSKMIKQLSPAVAVVLYGGNDAAFRAAPPERLADDFERDMNRLLDALEQQGIIPIMNTLARHGDSPGIDACGKSGEMTNWRIAVHTNAINVRAAEIACKRRLPLIDLRDAMDAADSRGLGSDGIHPTVYRRGSAVLDARGLRCGYNQRNYLTLRMLKLLKEALGW